MKNITLCLLGFLMPAVAFAQTETFDIATYTPPKGFKKVLNQGVISYSSVNANTGAFCVIAIYPSSTSTGDAQKDFDNEWQELAVTPFGAAANPKTEIQETPEGWKLVTGASAVKIEGVDCYIILNVISGFGKSMSFRTSLNDDSYTPKVDELFASMDLDQSSAPVNVTPITTTKAGRSGQFGLMSYTAPLGWKEEIFSDGVVFKPLDLPAGDILAVQIMQPLNAVGSLEQALAQSFEVATQMYNGTSMFQADGKYSKNAPKKSFNGWEYIRGKGGIRIGDPEMGLELFVVKVNNRFERIAILETRGNCGGVSRYYASDKEIYRNAIEELLYSLKFSDYNIPVMKNGSAKGTGIIGLWQGTIQSTGAATGVRLEVFTPVFFNNGQVYFGPKFPGEGLDELNSRIPPELYPRNWGTYSYSNGSGVLQMPFASIPFRTQSDKIFVTKNQREWPFIKLESVDGARFNGTYTMSEAYETFPVISFTADGKFVDKGAVRILLHESTTCINPGVTHGSGTYEVKNHSIIFRYSDGRKIKIAFIGTDYDKNNPSPAVLRMSYNDDPLNRR